MRESGAGRNTLIAFLTQISTGVFTAILTLYLVRALGPREFGLFSLAVGIGALVMLPSDFGISGSVSRYVAERYRDTSAVARLLADGLRLKLVISGSVAVALIALAGPIAAAYGEPSLAWPLRWMSIAVLGQSLVALYRYTFLAMRDAAIGLRIVVGESAVEAAASILLVVAAGGAASASAGRAIGYGFGTLLAFGFAFKHFGRAAFARSSRLRDARRALGRYAGALFAIDAAFAASVQMAPLMIGGFFGAREVGLFQAPSRLIVLIQYPGVSLANGVAPRMARSEDHEPETHLLLGALRYLILFQALIVAPVVVWSEPLVEVALGDGYERSAELLRQMGPYVFASGLGGLLTSSVNYLGEARRRVPIAIAEVTLTAALTAALLPLIGLEGAAWAANVVSITYVIAHVWVVRGLVEFPLCPLLLATARGLAAAAAAGGVLALFGTAELAWWEWFAGGAGALATFLAVIVALGEVSLAELRGLPRLVRARLR